MFRFSSFIRWYRSLSLSFGFRKEWRDQGLSVVIDSRRQQPVPALLSSLSELQVSPQWKICNYPPTHAQKSFQALLNLGCPLSCNAMSLSKLFLYDIPYTFPIVWPLSLWHSLVFLKRHTFEFVVTAVPRHFSKNGRPQGSCGEACAYLSVFNHTLGAGWLQSDLQETYHHVVMMSFSQM